MQDKLFRKALVVVIIFLFVGMSVASSTGVNTKDRILRDDRGTCSAMVPLPPPDFTDRNLELTICRRMSVRDFDGSDLSDQELSNILWAAYGYTSDGRRTIHSANGRYSICIYVIRRDGTYKYIPETHSLSLFRVGDYTFIGQYDTAPIKLGFIWNKRVSCDENMAWAEVGMIGQNVYFEANALNLGTVTTATSVNQLYLLRLPLYEKPVIIMPVGRPLNPYDFIYDPLPQSNLPGIVNNSITVEDAINNRSEITIWKNESLTRIEQSQIIWAAYGYSYFIDIVNNKRHRTIPSSHGTYPLVIFAANHTGIYLYFPGNHSVVEIAQGDRREDISEAVESDVMVSSASWILLSFVDTDVVNPDYLQAWYYEAGAIAHNVFLEGTAMSLSANIVSKIDDDALRNSLGISPQTNLQPIFIMPSGRTILSNPPGTPGISGPTSGKAGTEYTYSVVTTDPDGDNVSYWFDWGDGTNSGWTEFVDSGIELTAIHIWGKGTYIIKAKARDQYGAESGWGTLQVIMPRNKIVHRPFLNFLQQYPNLFPILRLLLQRL